MFRWQTVRDIIVERVYTETGTVTGSGSEGDDRQDDNKSQVVYR